MKINRNNYEVYVIDYLEGTLDESLVDAFIDFINQNPDLKEEVSLCESTSVVPENIAYPNKNNLLKEKFDREEEYNHAAVARIEGDSTDNENAQFENYLAKHPEKEKEAALFSKTKLKADTSILFSKKNKLYKNPKGKIIFMWSARVAAILIIALLAYLFVDQNTNTPNIEQSIASIENNTENSAAPSSINNEIKKQELIIPDKKAEPETQVAQVKEPVLKEIIHKPEEQKSKLRAELPQRQSISAPQRLNTLTASLKPELAEIKMGTMYLLYPEMEEEKLIGEKVKEKLNLAKLSKAGLNIMTSISNERFSYSTGEDGKVDEYNYDSRLLAFSIQGKKERR